ncbi:MAG TPA: glycosyltransferase family 39 protein [Patescibacteria group bacterium]|nr:glycosyltransferase family 39 protein [Patescibacteria group bacterium]
MQFVKKNKFLFIIFLLALIIRLYNLNTFPLGFHVDEAKVAWESLSIIKTLKDDHGNLFSLYYNSFGDYRPTGIFYASIPFIILFGRNVFAVRFASSLFGALTIFPLYFLSYQITKNKKISLLSCFLLSIIPWHVATSRATSEVVISGFLILSSLALLIRKPVLSFLLLGLSFLFYHSARVMSPILIFFWVYYLLASEYRKFLYSKKTFIGLFLVTLFSSFLLFSPQGEARLSQVALPNPNLRNIIINYTTYLDPNFFIGDIAKPFRYTTANVGIISIPIFVLFLLGIYIILKTNKNKILLLFFALGPIPASLTLEDSPNLHRAFFMLPFLIIIAAIGLNYFYENQKLIFKIFLFCIAFSFISFCINYFNTTNNIAFEYRDPQTKSLSNYIYQNKNNYDLIYVTNDPDSPYPWFYFFHGYNPKDVNKALEAGYNGKWQYENIVWDNTRCPRANAFDEALKNKNIKKILVIDNGQCTTDPIKTHEDAKIIKEFSYNGTVNYRVWEYKPIRI